ncbi:MAG: hypothetical protein WCV63_10640 [Negativicutes bacterium]
MTKKIFCLLLGLLIISPAFSADNFNLPQSSARPRTYLPGDLVHLVVGAPANVVKVTALMPDGETLTLDFERRTHIWHGLWEVPYGFKKGGYSAGLTATDVEGKTFEGQTNSFFIGEPALVTLIGLEITRESVVRPPAPPVTTLQELPTVRPERTVQKPPAAAKIKPAKAKAPQPKRQIKARKPAAPAIRPKPPALKKEDLLKLKLKLFTMARVHLTTQQYEKAKGDLRELLRLDPKNREIKAMLDRVEKVLKTKGGGND